MDHQWISLHGTVENQMTGVLGKTAEDSMNHRQKIVPPGMIKAVDGRFLTFVDM